MVDCLKLEHQIGDERNGHIGRFEECPKCKPKIAQRAEYVKMHPPCKWECFDRKHDMCYNIEGPCGRQGPYKVRGPDKVRKVKTRKDKVPEELMDLNPLSKLTVEQLHQYFDKWILENESKIPEEVMYAYQHGTKGLICRGALK